jgi:hypothetical protein
MGSFLQLIPDFHFPLQPEHVKDPSVEFVKSRLLGAAAEAKFARDPKIYSLAVTLKIADISRKDVKS